MDELEITQPDENLEGSEAVETIESAEEQALQDATHEPGARIEETGTFEQAEAIETALIESVDQVDATEVGDLPVPMPKPALEDEGGGSIGVEESEPSDRPLPGRSVGVDDANVGSPSEEKQVSGLTNISEAGEGVTAINPEPFFNKSEEIGQAQEPDLMPDPDLSPGIDGNVGEVPEPVDIVGLNPDFDDNVAYDSDPMWNTPEEVGQQSGHQPQLGQRIREHQDTGRAEVGSLPIPIPEPAETSDLPEPLRSNLETEASVSGDTQDLSPGFDGNVAESKDPPDPPGPNRGKRSEGGDDDGGEVTPINLPEMPEDDNEATVDGIA